MKLSGKQKRLCKRLLRTLARPGAYLREAGQDGNEEGGSFLLLTEGEKPRPLAGFDRQLLARCLGAGLLTGNQKEGWKISQAGRMALRRLLAGADPFISQHQARKVQARMVNGSKRRVLVSDGGSPLAWLARRKGSNGQPLIDSWQLAAGERLARDFYLAGLEPRLTSNWELGPGTGSKRRPAPGAGMEISDCRLAAIERLKRALDHLGPEMASLLLDVCCFQMGLGDCEKKRNWPRRSGKLVVRLALESLAAHYGLGAARKGWGADIGGRILHWGTPDYRPHKMDLPDTLESPG